MLSIIGLKECSFYFFNNRNPRLISSQEEKTSLSYLLCFGALIWSKFNEAMWNMLILLAVCGQVYTLNALSHEFST